jgi:carboxypeptidase T
MIETILAFMLWPQNQQTKYDYILNSLSEIQQKYSTDAQLITIGTDNFGRPIRGLKIGNGDVNVLVVGTHHGNEYGSTAVAMGAAEQFAKNPIANRTVYVIPVLNIDGYNNSLRYEQIDGRSIDPNRDYPGPCGTQGPFKSKATLALAQLIDQKNIVSSATLHTYWPAVLYPWGISTNDVSTEYDSQFIDLSKKAVVASQYQIGNSTEVLYAADGTFEDYAFWAHGIWSLLFEMGVSHSPSESNMQEMIQENVPGIRKFLAESPDSRAKKHSFTGKCSVNVLGRVHLE